MAIRVLIADDHSVVREGLRMFLQRDPDLEVVGEAADGAEAIRAGAIGYLHKDTQAAELRTAIKAAAAGQVHLSPQAAAYLLGAVRMPERPEPLTPREMDVLRLLAQGQSNKEIARTLHLVEETVKDHVRQQRSG